MTISQMAQMNTAYRNLYINNSNINKSQRSLASGYRVNSAADDAAGLAISERMRGQISGMSKATEHATQAVSLIQTAEGGLDNTSNALNRMRELAVQASNGTLSDSDRTLINKEFQALKSEIDRSASSTQYNGTKLLDGSLGGTKGVAGLSELGVSGISASGGDTLSGEAKFNISTTDGVTSITAQIGDRVVTNQIAAGDTSTEFDFGGGNMVRMDFTSGGPKDGVINGVGLRSGSSVVNYANAVSASPQSGMTFQIGANGGQDQRVTFNIGDMSSTALGLADIDINTVDGANKAIDAIGAAMERVSTQRSGLGAAQNRLDSSIRNLMTSNENAVAAESTIRDLDMAKEMINYTTNNIMRQASLAMQAQSMNMSRSYMMGLLMR